MTSSSNAVSAFTVAGSSRWRANWGGRSTASVLRRSGGKVVPKAMSSVGRSMPSVAFTMSKGRSVADMSTAPKAPSSSGFVTSVGMQLNSSIRPEISALPAAAHVEHRVVVGQVRPVEVGEHEGRRGQQRRGLPHLRPPFLEVLCVAVVDLKAQVDGLFQHLLVIDLPGPELVEKLLPQQIVAAGRVADGDVGPGVADALGLSEVEPRLVGVDHRLLQEREEEHDIVAASAPGCSRLRPAPCRSGTR